MRLLVLLALASLAVWQCSNQRDPVSLGPGIMVAEAPQQQMIDSPRAFAFDDYQITPLAEFVIKAKVLGTESYWFDRESDLAPIDLALGWGQMSDESVLRDIKIKQSGRWYTWRVDAFPIPRKAIETQSANMHLIAANKDIAEAIEQVHPGQIISLQGYLVSVTGDDGWTWRSSLTRNDTGNGACELIFVNAFQTLTFPAS